MSVLFCSRIYFPFDIFKSKKSLRKRIQSIHLSLSPLDKIHQGVTGVGHIRNRNQLSEARFKYEQEEFNIKTDSGLTFYSDIRVTPLRSMEL